MILVIFFSFAQAQTEEAKDNSVEARLHKIYVEHYSNPILDDDWFKIVDGIQEQSYTVKKGDTLWSISKIYFGDGFYWSKLWSVNSNITNPHLILVNDTLHFKAGSFDAAPSLSVEPGDESAEGDLLTSEEGSGEGNEAGGGEEATPPEKEAKEYTANNLPDFFVEKPYLIPPRFGSISVEKREPIRFKTRIRLHYEILNHEPEYYGRVASVGIDRMNTAENDIIIIERTGQELPTGSIMTILDPTYTELSQRGHMIKTLAVVRIIGPINEEKTNYEARVIEQFDGILVGSKVSSYQVQTVDLDYQGKVENVKAEVIKNVDKIFWASGDIIYLDIVDKDVAVGTMLNVSNKFDEKVSFFTHSGIVRIASVSPPYATGIVMYARTPISVESKTE
jgi:hypothetical protein